MPNYRTVLPIAMILCCVSRASAQRDYQPGPGAAMLPANPRLLLDASDIIALKKKIAGPFSEQWSAWMVRADQILAAPVDLPPRGGNWSHNYVCPVHGARLKLGKKIGPWQWEHICPVGNHVLLGDPSRKSTDFDANQMMEIHLGYADALVTLGVAFQVTGKAIYADRAREILLAYAKVYRAYPIHSRWPEMNSKREGGHVSAQPLTEATWLISITQGADLIWTTLLPQDRRIITEQILLPALNDVILPTHFGIQNMQCRMDSAIGLVGLLLNDNQLLHTALDDPQNGFRKQISIGVRDDGMWLEGSNGYHFFTLEGLWPFAEAARHCGIDLYSARYQSMFNAPLEQATPDLHLPDFNDSEIVDIAAHSDVYELAYARWKDPAYLAVIKGSPRNSELAVLYGVPELPSEAPQTKPVASHNSPASGYAMLRAGADEDATWLCLKYGPGGGMHGHQDKGTFVLYSHRRVLVADAGTHAYGSPLHAGWDKSSIAHNTLVVDQESQAPATGRCLAFGSQSGVDYTMIDAGDIYPDKKVSFIRTIAMLNARTIVGVDQVKTDGREHTLDISFHLPGTWANRGDGEPWTPPRSTPYAFIGSTTIQQAASQALLEIGVVNYDRPLELTLLETPAVQTDLITGDGVGESTAQHVPAIIYRRHAAQSVFIWAFVLDGNKPVLSLQPAQTEKISLLINNAAELRIDSKNHTVAIESKQ